MDRTAFFVDAGYLFAQGSVALSGKKLPRGHLAFDAERAAKALADLATKIVNLPLLRIYWYDGTSTGPTSQHISLAHLAGVKVRLGFVNSVGEQKGVDSLIVTDMINLARNGAMTDAVLLSGDEDLRVGVQQAQEYGVRVHLVGIKPSRGSQSLFLLQEADTTLELVADDLSSFLSVKTAPAQAPASVAPAAEGSLEERAVTESSADTLAQVANKVAADVPAADLEALVESIEKSGQTPKEFDGQLLGKSRTRLGAYLDSSQKTEIRVLFLKACQDRLKT